MTNHIPNKPSDEAMGVAREIERAQGRLLLLAPIARLIHAYAEKVRAEERERCAGIAERSITDDGMRTLCDIPEAIRNQ